MLWFGVKQGKGRGFEGRGLGFRVAVKESSGRYDQG